MKPIVIHRQDKNNVGDLYCNPLLYFNIEHDVIDISQLHVAQYDSNRPIIAGGGGVIENDFIGDVLTRVLLSSDFLTLRDAAQTFWRFGQSNNDLLRNEFQTKINKIVQEYIEKIDVRKNAPRIVWGAGHNANIMKKPRHVEWPGYLSSFDMVGVRDANSPFETVPCASCMHPALEKTYPITNDIIFFEHKKQLIKSSDFGKSAIPRFINTGNNIEQTIELLGGANIILTNSYHGAYWGHLLGKKVIVVDPWSSKFFNMKPAPSMIYKSESIDDIEDLIDSAKVYPDYLDECRIINNNYYSRVKEML